MGNLMFGRGYVSSDEMNFTTWMERASTELKLCLWPKRCYKTNKLLWLKYAYRTSCYYRAGDIDFIREDRWYSKNEFLVLRLKYGV